VRDDTADEPGLDPEMQFFRQMNPELGAHALPMHCLFLRSTTKRELILDIGREAREAQGLVKLCEDCASVRRQKKAAPAEAQDPKAD
jgi:hypothetical protein